MFYKISDQILFRSYDDFGYLTDNSEYGYHFLTENYKKIGEKYVSKSGAVMLSSLRRKPKSIDAVAIELANIFEDVSFDELKHDTEEFFASLVSEGFLCSGTTPDECENTERRDSDNGSSPIPTELTNSKIGPSDFFRELHVEIASVCNERCVHCYIPHEDKVSLIKPDLFYRAVADARKMNAINITISGGEPLLHPEVIPFIRYCHELDLSVNVLSNLTLLNDDMIKEMSLNPLLSVQTSIYSVDPKVHDGITGMPGSLNKTMEAVNKLISAEIPVQISCPIMEENKDSFLDVIKWGESKKISVGVEPQIFAQYDHTKRNLKHRLSSAEIAEVVRKLLESGYGDHWVTDAVEKEKARPKQPICTVCRFNLCVSATGAVYPCVGWETNEIDTLNNNSLKDIWEKSKKICLFRNIQWSHFPKCVNCKDRGYCVVCMMNNANENKDGDPFRINPFHCEVAEAIHQVVDQYRGIQK